MARRQRAHGAAHTGGAASQALLHRDQAACPGREAASGERSRRKSGLTTLGRLGRGRLRCILRCGARTTAWR